MAITTHTLLLEKIFPRVANLRTTFQITPEFRGYLLDPTKVKDMATSYLACLRGMMSRFQKHLPDTEQELSDFANMAHMIESKSRELQYGEAPSHAECILQRSGCCAWLEASKNVLELELLVLEEAA